MPRRLTLTFRDADDGKDITFVCDSGDYDPGVEFDAAVEKIQKRLKAAHGEWSARLSWEDV